MTARVMGGLFFEFSFYGLPEGAMKNMTREKSKFRFLKFLLLMVFLVVVSEIFLIEFLKDLFPSVFASATFWLVDALVVGALTGVALYFGFVKPNLELKEKLESERDRVESLSSLGKVVFYCGRVEVGKKGAWEPVITFVSSSIEEVFGYKREEISADFRWWLERVHPEDRDRAVREAYCVFEKGFVDQVYRFEDSRGEYQWVRDRLTVVRGPGGKPVEIRGLWIVVTDQVLSEESHRKRSRQLEALLEASRRINSNIEIREILRSLVESALSLIDGSAGGAGLVVGDRVVFSEYVQKGRYHMVNYSFGPGEGIPGWVMVNKKPYVTNDAASDPLVVRKIQEKLGFRNAIDVPILGREGNLLGCFEIHDKRGGRDFTDEDVRMLTALADSAAVAIQNALMVGRIRESAEVHRRLYTAVEQAGEMIVITSPDGTIQYVNPTFERVTGYRKDEAVGENPRILKSGVHGQEFYEELWNTITSGKTWSGRFVNRRKDGTIYQEEAVISPVFGEDGEIINFVAVKKDITEKVNLENQLRQSQKMEAVGRLAGGIAHDINNYLAALTGYAEIIKMKYRDDSFIQEKTGKMLETIFKSSELITQLLAFSRKQPSEPRIVNPNKLLTRLKSMLARLIGERIEFHFYPAPDLWNVKIDPLHLEQVVVNLVVNARDAMPEGGRLLIETKNVVFDDDYLRRRPIVKSGEYVMIAVSDTGVGIPPEIQEKIFEPFFTTKGRETGSGLGLSTVYGIVRQNEGYIWVYSEPGRGATFKVYFPRCEEGEPDEDLDVRDGEVAVLKGVRVLYVEDNEVVREATADFLRQAGCEVVSAVDGRDALAKVGKEGVEFDVLITDVVMPGLSGRELADSLKKERPNLKVLFTTGYSDEVVVKYGVSGKSEAILKKPFRGAELIEKIKALQDDSNSAS